MTAPLKIGAVPYLNALPLIEGLESRPDIHMTFAPPANLEMELDAGRLDGALVPVAALFERPHISMFPFSGIASDYESGSVLFFSAGSKIRKVAHDEGSRTSVLLLKVLLQERGHSPEWIPMAPDLAAMLEAADGALLIGDEALARRRDSRLDFDLVDRWRRLTDLPFVFAVWAARTDHPRRSEMAKLFTDASVQGLSRLDSLAHRKSGCKG
ncbi:menaquinone biosynthesis protein, partial [bacterium]|nr:menaquinone biosynthesis protein [bacterium]